uniref:DUF551 domain-containing protein n=1 Tax=viral metagenome TaxID=1070528 RepID=A0A6M3MF14_9ZZZZ
MNEENQIIADKASVDVETLVMPLKWNSIADDGLPPERTRCIAYGRWQTYTKKANKLNGDYTILSMAIFANGLWHRKDLIREWFTYESDKITHWIKIPDVPL